MTYAITQQSHYVQYWKEFVADILWSMVTEIESIRFMVKI